MSNEIKIVSPALTSQIFMPTNYNEAMAFCEKCAKEDFVPKDMRQKPMTIFLSWQMGASVGLDFFASIQNIAVINGRPCIYGDAALAVIMNHPLYQEHEEWYEIKGQRVTSFLATDPDLYAFCKIIPKKGNPTIRSFSVKDAMQARLWEKDGPWKQYPSRMLQMRARGFCMRDAIPGALKGLYIREEVIDLPPEDYHVIGVVDTKEQPKLGIDAVKQTITQAVIKKAENVTEKHEEFDINSETGEITEPVQSAAPSFEEVKKQMESAKTVEDLIIASDVARAIQKTKVQHDELSKIYRHKQTEVRA